jgi:ABC-type lipoprotein release transport system permease subunit
MIRTRGRKIYRDVLARKGRTALVSIAIFIGVLGTIALFSLSDIIVSQLREDIKEDELSMITLFTAIDFGEAAGENGSIDPQKVSPESVLPILRDTERVPGIVTATAFFQEFSYIKLKESDKDFEQVMLNADSESYDERLPIEPMRLLEDRGDNPRFPIEGANEIAIEQRMAEKYDLDVGDTVWFRILTPSEDGEIGHIEEWTITGIVFHPYAQSPNSYIYSHISDANYITGLTGVSGFRTRFVDFSTAEDQEETLKTVLRNNTPYTAVFTQVADPAQNELIQGAQTLAGTMSFLALVALIVSGFLVINVITSIVVEQRRQIGVMKSMGATRGDNFIMYSGIAFSYGIIAVIPAVILGIPLGNAAAQALAPQLNTVLDGFQYSPPSIILGIIVGLAVPVIASIIPVFNGTKVRILEAMTDLGIDAKYGSGPVAKLIEKLPIPITIRQGLSNVSIKKSRLFFTVITLSIAVGAFMGIFAVFNSLTDGINQFIDSYNVQVAVIPKQIQEPDRLIQVLETNFVQNSDSPIKSVEPGFNIQVEFEGYEPAASSGGPPGIFAYGYDINSDDPAFRFDVDEGQPLSDATGQNGVIFSSLLASNMDKSLGDDVVMKVSGASETLKIVGISDFPLDQVWLDWRTLARVSGYEVGSGTLPAPNEYFTTVSVDDSPVATIGIDENVAAVLPYDAGEGLVAGERQVIISQSYADSGGYEVGSEISLTATTDTSRSQVFTIAGIFTIPEGFADQLGSDGDAIPDEAIGVYWRELADLEGLGGGGTPVPQMLFMNTNLDDPTADEIDDIIDEVNEVLLDEGINADSFNFVSLVDQISQAFFIIQTVLQAVALLIALVGALGLLTTLSMSVYERQKEIGVMRSVGAGSMTVSLQFLTEGLVVGFIAWLIGLPLAYLIEVLLLGVTGFDETFPATFPVLGAVIGFVGMMVITTIASLWPSISASRKTVSDILRYQ